MKNIWIGPAALVAKVLELNCAEYTRADNGKAVYRLEGPTINTFMNSQLDSAGSAFDIVEVHPETVCFPQGRSTPITDLLKGFARACKVTVGLPIAPSRKKLRITLDEE